MPPLGGVIRFAADFRLVLDQDQHSSRAALSTQEV
jgi:hypothetical protein